MQLRRSKKNFKSWVEISKIALLRNLEVFRKITSGKTKILCVVKANAYGHGLAEIAKILSTKADWFGVDNIDEALIIRRLKIKKPLLVLGYIPFESLKEAIENDISLTIYNQQHLRGILSL